MGHVTVRTDEHKRDKRERERPLLQATRSLTKQPGGVAHLQLSLRDKFAEHDRHTDCQHLIDLRCASALVCLPHSCCDKCDYAPAFAVP